MSSGSLVSDLPSYSLILHSENQVVVDIALTADLPAFQGHFPGHPVLPGVVQLHWAALIGQQYFSNLGQAQEIEQLKFQNIIAPPISLRLEIDLIATNKISFRYSQQDRQMSGGRIQFTESEN